MPLSTPDTSRADALLDPARLAALDRTGLLDSPPEESFDRLTRLAVETIGAPVSLVSLVADGRQFFKSALGLPEPWATERQTPLSHSFCRHTLGGEPLVVTDAREDPLLRDNLAIPDLGVVAYAGVPITLASGETLGAFCVIDSSPREWTEDELAILRDLAGAAVTEAELRLALAAAREDARIDALTGLINHGAFHQRLREGVADAEADGENLALVLFDVDHFKDINDTFGHLAGDAALAEVARRVGAQIRTGDTLARVGGEEFAWILLGASVDDAALAAERACSAVRAEPLEGVGFVTVSAGVACLDGADDPRRLYEAADSALYAAKDAGRDCVVRWGTATAAGQTRRDRRRAAAAERHLLALRAREHEALAQIARMAAEGVSPDRVFEVVAEQVARLMQVEAGLVWRFEPGESVVVGSYGQHGSQLGVRFPAGGGGALAKVRETGSPSRADYRVLGDDDSTAARIVPQGYTFGVAAPIHVSGERWGAVLAATTGSEPPEPSAEGRLNGFAELVGLAIAEAQERSALSRKAAEQAALRRIATQVAREVPLESVAGAVAEEAGTLLRAVETHVSRAGITVASWTAPPLLDPVRAPADSRLTAPIRVADAVWGVLEVSGADDAAATCGQILHDLADMLALAVASSEARVRLAEMADVDALTRMPHHRAFHERLHGEVARSQRHGRRLALVLADLDGFGRVNHDHGHDAGDRLIVEIAARLSGHLRPGDWAARTGGGQFAWVLPECGELEAWEAAERLRTAVAATPFGGIGPITISAGVCDLDSADDAEQLHRRAGGALYWAKRHGRDRVFIYAPEVIDVLSAEERAERLERQQALGAVRMIARVVDAKDPATRQHSERVAAIAVRLAEEMSWSPERAALLHEAGLVHDVGKIGVPDAVLFKVGALSDDDFAQIREHAALGAKIVSEVLSPEQSGWVRSHHERYDGRGYPDGLADEAIPEGARILTLADSWDVMTVSRHYSAPMSIGEALDEARRVAGRQFDPVVVEALERLLAVDPTALDGSAPMAQPPLTTGVPPRVP